MNAQPSNIGQSFSSTFILRPGTTGITSAQRPSLLTSPIRTVIPFFKVRTTLLALLGSLRTFKCVPVGSVTLQIHPALAFDTKMTSVATAVRRAVLNIFILHSANINNGPNAVGPFLLLGSLRYPPDEKGEHRCCVP